MQPSTFRMTPTARQEIVRIVDARIREARVAKEDFSELKSIVAELAKEQKELVAAQTRTETKMEELAAAQKRTELRLEELATAQKELAEAQKRTELAIAALTEAMHETRADIKEMRGDIKGIQSELGGLGGSVGYALENEAYRHLPEILREKYGLTFKEKSSGPTSAARKSTSSAAPKKTAAKFSSWARPKPSWTNAVARKRASRNWKKKCRPSRPFTARWKPSASSSPILREKVFWTWRKRGESLWCKVSNGEGLVLAFLPPYKRPHTGFVVN
jgi:hypothetical protein